MSETEYQEVSVPMPPPGSQGPGASGPQFPYDPRSIYTEEPGYNTWVHRALLAQTDYRPFLLKNLDDTKFFEETKRAWRVIINGAFDKTNVLAKIMDLEIAEWRFEIIVIEAQQDMVPVDVDSQEYTNFKNNILQHFRMFISRASGGWERELQNKIETSQSHEFKQTLKLPKEKKRGLWPFGGDR